jgi:hypothetical protein
MSMLGIRQAAALSVAVAVGWTAVVGCSGSAVVDGSGGGSATGSQSTARGATTASGGTNYGICDGPGQCALTYRRCCPACNTPALDDLEPVAIDQVDAFHKAQCPAPEPCPDCVGCPNGSLFAFCEAGQCRGNSLVRGGFADCTRTADRRLPTALGKRVLRSVWRPVRVRRVDRHQRRCRAEARAAGV